MFISERKKKIAGIICLFIVCAAVSEHAAAVTEQYIGHIGGVWGIPEHNDVQPQTLSTAKGDSSFYLDGTIVPDNGYILPDSDNHYYTIEELSKLTHKGVRYAINEIYAEKGYTFTQKKELKKYFGAQSWYNGGDTSDQNLVKSRMNDYEIQNIDLLLKLENELWGGEYQLD